MSYIRQNYRRFLYPLMVIALFCCVALMPASAVAQAHGNEHTTPPQKAAQKRTPVGTWNLMVTFPDGHTEASQVIFNRNGVFVNLTPGPGGGKWFPTEDDATFSYAFSEVILVNGTFTALVEVQQTGKLNADGTAFTASGTGSVYDPATGNLLMVNHTTTVATRA